MLAKQHLCHGVHEHRQQSHRLDLIEELSVALRPVRMGEGVLVVALDSLKLLLVLLAPWTPERPTRSAKACGSSHGTLMLTLATLLSRAAP